MSSFLPGDLTLGTKESVGRYFSLISVIPSLVLSAWLYLLLASGAPDGEPSVGMLEHNLGRAQPAQGLAVASFALILALVLHPLQFSMVQALEGYWGTTALGRELQTRKAVRHLLRLGHATKRADRLRNTAENEDDEWVAQALLNGTREQRTRIMREEYELAESSRVMDLYPSQPIHVLPTRLGNMLRRYEMLAGAAYDLPFLTMATHVGLVAHPRHLTYMQDQRNSVDLAARMTFTGLIAATATTVVMWPHGLWLLLALVPYAAAFLSYRGAVGSAAHYGAAMGAVSDLNRFRLYEALHMEAPTNTTKEKEQNTQIVKLRYGSPMFDATYSHEVNSTTSPNAESEHAR
jgi:hypothetical protein